MYSNATGTICQEQNDLLDVATLSGLSNWAPQLPQEREVYPNFWSLRGWKCFQIGE